MQKKRERKIENKKKFMWYWEQKEKEKKTQWILESLCSEEEKWKWFKCNKKEGCEWKYLLLCKFQLISKIKQVSSLFNV